MTKQDKQKTLPLKDVAGLLCLSDRRVRDLAEAGKIPEDL